MNTPQKAQFAQRLQDLRQHMANARQDAALIFSLDNLRYLYNYSGEAAYGLVTQTNLYLITDYRFLEQAEDECVSDSLPTKVICRDRDKQSLGRAIAAVLQNEQAHHVWFEAEHISVGVWNTIAQDNPQALFTPSTGVLEQQRKTKDAWEVAQIKAAAHIADEALAALLPQIRIGASEAELALELDYQMQKRGSQGLSFVTILGFGARSALPHCIPSQKRLQEGDLIVLDFGAVVNGYRSDMTRSFVAGQANPQQQAMFDTVSAAQQAAFALLRNGIAAVEVNAASAAVLQASRFKEFAGPGLGHGLGIKLHEQPFISPVCREQLMNNYVVTIEPGIYIPQYGGVRIEDDVLITENGFEFLTHAPKQFELPI
jgi:Xaa-Pro aminopeptidase/Xaa-Pro dipeptidase